MQKPYKDNYMLVKAYLPIVLLDTIEKTFKSILARKIRAITKIHYFLPNTYFGKKRNISTKYVVHFLIEKTYAAWDREKKVSVLMLDITTFDNIS